MASAFGDTGSVRLPARRPRGTALRRALGATMPGCIEDLLIAMVATIRGNP